MAIASGINLQKLSVAATLLAQSFTFGGVIAAAVAEDVPPHGSRLVVWAEPNVEARSFTRSTFLVDDAVDHPSSGVDLSLDDRAVYLTAAPAVTASGLFDEALPDVPESTRIVVEVNGAELAASITAGSLLGVDATVSPPFGAPLIVTVDGPTLLPSFLLESNQREDAVVEVQYSGAFFVRAEYPYKAEVSVTLAGLRGEVVAEVPPAGSRLVVHAESPRESLSFTHSTFLATGAVDNPAAGLSITLDDRTAYLTVSPAITVGSLRDDFVPEDPEPSRTIVEAEAPRIAALPVTIGGLRDDVAPAPTNPELYRQIVWQAESAQRAPYAVVRFEPIANAPVAPVELEITRKAIVQAEQLPAAHSVLQGSITPPSAKSQGVAAFVSAEVRENRESIVRIGLIEDVIPDLDQFSITRQLVHKAPVFDIPPATFLLESNQRVDVVADVGGGLSIGSAHHSEAILAPQAIMRSPPVAEPPPDFDQFSIERKLVHQALQPQIPPASFVLESNQREDVSPELYRHIAHKALPIADAISTLRSGFMPADVIPDPPEHARVIVAAEPIPVAHSWLHDTVPPVDVVRQPSSGVKVESAHHGDQVTQPQSITLSGIVPADVVPVVPTVPDVRSISIDAVEAFQIKPYSFVRESVLGVLFTAEHFGWYQNDSADVNATTQIGLEDQAIEIPVADLDTSHHLRLHLANRGALASNTTWLLQYQRNFGTWEMVNNTTSQFVRIVDGLPLHNALTSQRLTAELPSFDQGTYVDANDGAAGNSIPTQHDCEHVFSIAFRSADVLPGDRFRFRLWTPVHETELQTKIYASCTIKGVATEFRSLLVRAEPASVAPYTMLRASFLAPEVVAAALKGRSEGADRRAVTSNTRRSSEGRNNRGVRGDC